MCELDCDIEALQQCSMHASHSCDVTASVASKPCERSLGRDMGCDVPTLGQILFVNRFSK